MARATVRVATKDVRLATKDTTFTKELRVDGHTDDDAHDRLGICHSGSPLAAASRFCACTVVLTSVTFVAKALVALGAVVVVRFVTRSLVARSVVVATFGLFVAIAPAWAQEDIPALTEPVNDFASVIDADSERGMEALIRSLQQASGDVVVVATVPTFEPYGDIREYAQKMFENGGRGIGGRERDNGLLVLLAVNDREVWVEVGYDLEQFITDGFAGETTRQYMIPELRNQQYGRGLLAGVSRIIGRIAERRNVTLQGVRPPPPSRRDGGGGSVMLVLFVLFILLSAFAGRTRGNRRRRGWSSGVGPFGGGFGGGLGGFGGGGFGGGGFGGGFGGFGGGRSGGGGGGGSW